MAYIFVHFLSDLQNFLKNNEFISQAGRIFNLFWSFFTKKKLSGHTFRPSLTFRFKLQIYAVFATLPSLETSASRVLLSLRIDRHMYIGRVNVCLRILGDENWSLVPYLDVNFFDEFST
jgi:hypothetical protein